MTIKITMPIYWVQPFKTKKDKTWLVGMNNYRNWHHRISHEFKKDFESKVTAQLVPTDRMEVFKVHYTLYYKRCCDGGNIIALIEKVVLDALVKYGSTTDDNINNHIGSCWTVGGRDKYNPRVEILITRCTQ